MRFVGPVSELSGRWIRPHDVEILVEPSDGAAEAQIDRIVHLGFEVRVELSLGEGDSTWVQTTRSQAEELELAEGQIVWLRPEAEPGQRLRPGVRRLGQPLHAVAAGARRPPRPA